MNPNGVPQNLKPWPKGVSGNPKGAAKGPQLITRLRRKLMEPVVNKDGTPKGNRHADEVIDALVAVAERGDIRAISLLLERMHGKVPDRVIADVTSHDSDNDRTRLDSILAAARSAGGLAGPEADSGAVESGHVRSNGFARPMANGTALGAAEPEVN